MTDGSKAIVKRAAISVLVIFLSLTILRAFLNYIILAVIIYAALQLFNRKYVVTHFLTLVIAFGVGAITACVLNHRNLLRRPIRR